MSVLSEDVINRIKELRHSGVSKSETARMLNISHEAVIKYGPKHNFCGVCGKKLPPRNHKCKKCLKKISKMYGQGGYHIGKGRPKREQFDQGLRTRYGITVAEFTTMIIKQQWRCAICGRVPYGKEKSLAVDHDHTTGQIRGLLCMDCNIGIGRFREDLGIMKAAMLYLSSPTAVSGIIPYQVQAAEGSFCFTNRGVPTVCTTLKLSDIKGESK